jgi:hypothetical protein
MAWMASGRHLAVHRVQVRLNFAALIDWSGSSRDSLGSLDPEATCSQVLGIQTVALMFLTTGPIPHERSWRLWLDGAAGWLPYQGLPAAKVGAGE